MMIQKLFFCLFCLAAAASPVRAEEPVAPPAAPTEVQVDEEAGVIRFVVDGETVATIDRNGLTVEGDVRFTGTLVDIGAGSAPTFERSRED